MAKGIWAGLDIGVETTSICVIDGFGEILKETTCSSQLASVHRELSFLKRRRNAKILLEACTGLHLARGLRNLGYSVELYEARALSKFLRVRRNKTDAGDAIGIAEAGRFGAATVSRVHLKSMEAQCLQARLTIRRRLVRHRVAAMNLLARQIGHFGGRLMGPGRSKKLKDNVNAEIRRIFGRTSNGVRPELERLVGYCEQLLSYERSVERELKLLAAESDVCRRLMTVPGVGPLCALTFYASVDDPNRFRRSSDVGSYFGLTPKLYQSGLTSRTPRITKMGNSAVRSLLFRASTQFMRSTGPTSAVRDWTSKLEERSCRKKSRIALARKLATIMLAIWKSGDEYRPALLVSGKV